MCVFGSLIGWSVLSASIGSKTSDQMLQANVVESVQLNVQQLNDQLNILDCSIVL